MDAIPVVFAAFAATYGLTVWIESLVYRVAGKRLDSRALLYALAPSISVASVPAALIGYFN